MISFNLNQHNAMINWNSLFNRQQEISTEEVKNLLHSPAAGSHQLLDVRQPAEYRTFHLPGALLIPLNDLAERLAELDPERETIVYCRSGARSNAACQILRAENFRSVRNMTGGILQWQGETAIGGEQQGLDYFLSGSYDNPFSMAYGMESGLQQFYQILAKRAEEPKIARLLEGMAVFEEGHMARLAARYRNSGGEQDLAAQSPVPEGGLGMEDLREAFGEQLRTPEAVLQLAMGFEAQAYDLYSRLARAKGLREFALEMAAEEQQHLNRLSGELDRLLTEESTRA